MPTRRKPSIRDMCVLLVCSCIIVTLLQPLLYLNSSGNSTSERSYGFLFMFSTPTTPTPSATYAPSTSPTSSPIIPQLLRSSLPLQLTSPMYKALRELQCIPRVCAGNQTFKPHGNFTLLASFPGSGNTWTRSTIEQGTKVWTGSVYDDLELFHSGFAGELLDPYSGGNVSQVSVIKSHAPLVDNQTVSNLTTGVIVIMRSPFDAIKAEFSRVMAYRLLHPTKQEVNATANITITAEVSVNYTTEIINTHTYKVSPATMCSDFPAIFASLMKDWLDFSQFWISPKHRMSAFVNTASNVTSYEYAAKFSWSSLNKKIPVLIMFYEDFIRFPVEANFRLFTFIKMQMLDKMPTTAWEATVCALSAASNMPTKERRVHAKNEYNIYFDLNSTFVRNNTISKACEQMSRYWFPQIWGECNNPVPQVSRIKPSQLHFPVKLQKDFCKT